MIVGALTFFAVLSLGPILEHLQMAAGKPFWSTTEEWLCFQRLDCLRSQRCW